MDCGCDKLGLIAAEKEHDICYLFGGGVAINWNVALHGGFYAFRRPRSEAFFQAAPQSGCDGRGIDRVDAGILSATPLAAEVLRFAAYNQIHTMEDAMGTALGELRGAPEAFDGFAEMTWADRADLDKAMNSAEGRALLADEKRFIDLANSPISLGKIAFGLTSN